MKTNIRKNNFSFFLFIRFYYILILLFAINVKVHSQQSYAIELENKITDAQNIKDKVDALNELAWISKCSDHEKSYNYAMQAYESTKELGSNSWAAISYVNNAYIFIVTKNDFDKAMICFKRAYKISEKLKYTSEAKSVLAKIFDGLGLINYKMGELDMSIDCYNQALALFLQEAQYFNASNCYHNLAMIYEKIGDIKQADRLYKREVANNSRINKYSSRKSVQNQNLLTMVIGLEEMDYDIK